MPIKSLELQLQAFFAYEDAYGLNNPSLKSESQRYAQKWSGGWLWHARWQGTRNHQTPRTIGWL